MPDFEEMRNAVLRALAWKEESKSQDDDASEQDVCLPPDC